MIGSGHVLIGVDMSREPHNRMGPIRTAGVLLLLGGIWQAAVGVAALAHGGQFTAPDGYTFTFSIAAWGWVHLIVGVFAIAVGIAVFGGGALARRLGMALASASLIANFLWLPIEPGWSVAVIGLDLFVLWALAARVKAAGPSDGGIQ